MGAALCTTNVSHISSLCGENFSRKPANNFELCNVSAEIYKLSEDHMRWQKLYPNITSIVLNQLPLNNKNTASTPVLQLNITDLQNRSDGTGFLLPCDSEIRRYSDRFIYWRSPSTGEVFALNVASKEDAVRLLSVTGQLSNKVLTKSNNIYLKKKRLHDERFIMTVHVSTLFHTLHGKVIENPILTFTKCFLYFQPLDELKVLDEQERCIFIINTAECILSIDCTRLLVRISFPSRAICIQFSEQHELRDICHQILNKSSEYLTTDLTTFCTTTKSINVQNNNTTENTYEEHNSKLIKRFQANLNLINLLISRISQRSAQNKTKILKKDSRNSQRTNSEKNEIFSDCNATIASSTSLHHFNNCKFHDEVDSQKKNSRHKHGEKCQFYDTQDIRIQKRCMHDSANVKSLTVFGNNNNDNDSTDKKLKSRLKLCVKKLATNDFFNESISNAQNNSEMMSSSLHSNALLERPDKATTNDFIMSRSMNNANCADVKNLCYFRQNSRQKSKTSSVINSTLSSNSDSGLLFFEEVLYLMRYVLVLRISALKNLLPYTDFTKKIFPGKFLHDLNFNVTSEDYLVHYIHLDCIQHSAFSVKKQLDMLSKHQVISLLPSHSMHISNEFNTKIRNLDYSIKESISSNTSPITSSCSSESSTVRREMPSTCSSNNSENDETNSKNDTCESLFSVIIGKHTNLCENRRNAILLIGELLETEELFVDNLREFLNIYLTNNSLQTHAIRKITRKVLKVHETFLNSLRDACDDKFIDGAQNVVISYSQIKDIISRIAVLFINNSNKFKIHCKYVATHLRHQKSHFNNSTKNENDKSLCITDEKSLAYESHAIRPIQRLLKYPLFLNRLAKFCRTNSVQFQQISNATQQMKNIADYVNQMQRIQDEYEDRLEKIEFKHLNKNAKNCNFLIEQLRVTHKIDQIKLQDLLMFAKVKLIKDSAIAIDYAAFILKRFLLLIPAVENDKSINAEKFIFLSVSQIEFKSDSNMILHFDIPIYKTNYLIEMMISPYDVFQKKKNEVWNKKDIRRVKNSEENKSSSNDESEESDGSDIVTQPEPEQESPNVLPISDTINFIQLVCCHSDIQKNFLNAVRRAQKMMAKEKDSRLNSYTSINCSDHGY